MLVPVDKGMGDAGTLSQTLFHLRCKADFFPADLQGSPYQMLATIVSMTFTVLYTLDLKSASDIAT